MQLQAPHSQVPRELQLDGQGFVEQSHAGPDQPRLQVHTSQTHVPKEPQSHVPSPVVVHGVQPSTWVYPGSHTHSPQTQEPLPAPPQSVGQGSLEHEQSSPFHRGVHLQVPHWHEPLSGSDEQLLRQGSDVSHEQSEPDHGGTQSHEPQLQTPFGALQLFGHGSAEQLHTVPFQPATQSQVPSHPHAPLSGPEHSSPPSPMGHVVPTAQSQRRPVHAASQTHSPQMHSPLGELQFCAQGNVEQSHAAPENPMSQTQTPHSQVPWSHAGSHVWFTSTVHGRHPSTVVQGSTHTHSPHVQLPWPSGSAQSVPQGRMEHEQSGVPSGASPNVDEHWHSPHTHSPLGKEQLFTHVAVGSHAQSAPVYKPSHSQAPQVQLPLPPHSRSLATGHGRIEQLQVGPSQPGRHEHEPHSQTPLSTPPQTSPVPGSTGHGSEESQSQ